VKIQSVFENAIQERGRGTYLKPIEVHDVQCHIADAVLAGGIRRAAMISLFSFDDKEMLTCKSGNWWETNPERGRANNSAVAVRSKISKKDFDDFWTYVENSKSGEPGIFFTDDRDGNWGLNPCAEISLRPNQFCNLTTINGSNLESQEDLNKRAEAAAFIGTLQAAYTNFHYLRDIWQETTEKEALLGVSMTGIGSGEALKYDLVEASEAAKQMNEQVAKILGIRKAARVTAIKPEGTASLTLGTSSGIHGWWDPYYIRTMRIGKNESIYTYLKEKMPELLEDEIFKPDTISVLSIPQKSPKNAILRHESPIDTLERVKKFNTEWVWTGHRDGVNKNNVSCTINVKDDEWNEVGKWMWDNRKFYTAIAVLPYDGGTYKQAPFQTTDEETYNKMLKKLEEIDLSEIIEEEDETNLQGELACAGGACIVTGTVDSEIESGGSLNKLGIASIVI
jgi:ribonucleoside-diphosphate reductase alpha chain